MRILFVCKRRPQQRDLVTRPYGRFHHLPLELAERGHSVRLLMLDHRGGDEGEDVVGCVQRSFLDVRRGGFTATMRRVRASAELFQPDWIVACSDTWAGVLGRWLAKRIGARLCIDAYDNYEAYMPWNLPMHLAWRRALRAADAISVAGPQLADLLGRGAHCTPVVVPMAADPQFVPQEIGDARGQFRLPVDRPLAGYFGGWGLARGTHLLLEAFELLRLKEPKIRLVLSGKPPEQVVAAPGVFAVGYVHDWQLPALINAVDVACVITAQTAFGKYSYPSKLCEAMACGTAIAATDTGPVHWMLRGNEDCLSPPGDAAAFADNMSRGLAGGLRNYGDQPSWRKSAALLEAALG